MPQSNEDWINLTFHKEFIDKVKTHEDNDFMSKFLFEKAEMTYTYLEMLYNMLESLG